MEGEKDEKMRLQNAIHSWRGKCEGIQGEVRELKEDLKY
jgi:hypothetical protein